MPEEAKEAAATLGYDQNMWDHDLGTTCDEKMWNELTSDEQEAARVLGYDEVAWNEESSSSSSSSDE